MKAHKIHVVRFYKPKPKAGHTCAYSEERKLLAVSRENGSIEIYNFSNPNAPLLQTSEPPSGSELDRSVEALAFVPDGRLFSVGLHGFVLRNIGSGDKIFIACHFHMFVPWSIPRKTILNLLRFQIEIHLC